MGSEGAILCGCCMGLFLIVVGITEVGVWLWCIQPGVCLVNQDAGANYYLGAVSGMLAVAVGTLGMAQLLIFNKIMGVIVRLLDILLLFSALVGAIVAAVNASQEVTLTVIVLSPEDNIGKTIYIVIATLESLLALISLIFAFQFCCLDQKEIKEEEQFAENENNHIGPLRVNPLTDPESSFPRNGASVPRIIEEIQFDSLTMPNNNSHYSNGRSRSGQKSTTQNRVIASKSKNPVPAPRLYKATIPSENRRNRLGVWNSLAGSSSHSPFRNSGHTRNTGQLDPDTPFYPFGAPVISRGIDDRRRFGSLNQLPHHHSDAGLLSVANIQDMFAHDQHTSVHRSDPGHPRDPDRSGWYF